MLTTADGVETKIGPGEAELISEATGWNAAIGDGVVLFFGTNHQTTREVPFETPESMFSTAAGTVEWLQQHGVQGALALHGAVDCANQTVDKAADVAKTMELDEIYAVLNPGEATQNGTTFSIVQGHPQDLVLITAPDGGLWPILRMQYVYDASLSPDGQTLAATYLLDGEYTLGLIPVDFGGIFTTSLTDQERHVTLDQPYGVTWLLG